MKNKFIIMIIFLLLLIQTITPITSSNMISYKKIIYVDDDGDADYTAIQDAIDDASDGDTVYVYNGTYHETIMLNKSIILEGENKYKTIIDGRYFINHSYGIIITLYDSNSVSEIKGFTIQNFDYGIIKRAPLGGSLYIKISDNVIINNVYGIKTHTTIGGAHIGLQILGNIIEKNEFGIYLNCIRNVLINRNQISLNGEIGVLIEGYFAKIIENNIFDNAENAYNNAGFFHLWSRNYWGNEYNKIKFIPGKFFNIDWNSNLEPYNIE